MKRIFALILAALLLTACSGTQTADSSATESATKGFKDKGPSAVYTAVPDPNATAVPTSVPTPAPSATPIPERYINTTSSTVDDDKYFGIYSLDPNAEVYSGVRFDHETDPYDSYPRQNETAEAYNTRVFANVKKTYDSVLNGLDRIDTLYVSVRSSGTKDIGIPLEGLSENGSWATMCVALKGKALEKWKSIIKNSSMKLNADYRHNDGKDYVGNGGGITFYIKNGDGNLIPILSGTSAPCIHGDAGFRFAQLEFATAEAKKAYNSFCTAVETEAIARMYGLYRSPAHYPFVELDGRQYVAKNEVALGDPAFCHAKTSIYSFKYSDAYRYGINIGSNDALYVKIERNGKTYFAAFAETKYLTELKAILGRATLAEYSGGSETLADGTSVSFYAFDSMFSSIGAMLICTTNGIIPALSTDSAMRIKFKTTADEKAFCDIQQRLANAITEMRTADSPYCCDHVITEI